MGRIGDTPSSAVGLEGTFDSRYLRIANNLSDLNSVSTAITNLGLQSGGTNSIWVLKAGDTMTGALTITPSADAAGILSINNSANTTNVFNVDTRPSIVSNLTFTQPVGTTSAPTGITFNFGAHTLTNGQFVDLNLNFQRTVTWANAGVTIGNVRNLRVGIPTYTFSDQATTISTAQLFSLNGAPIAGNNATITNSIQLSLLGASLKTGTGAVTNAFNIQLTTHTGATNTYGIDLGSSTTALTQFTGIRITNLTGNATTVYGYFLNGITATGTTNYGLYIGGVSGASTNWAIYAPTGQNQFGGLTGVGVAPASTYQLNVLSSFSIAAAAGLNNDVTHTAAQSGIIFGFRNRAALTHSTGTVAQLNGTDSVAIYQGASSLQANIAVTTMYGAYYQNSIRGVSPVGTITNAIGFIGDTPSNLATGSPAVTITNTFGAQILDQGSGSGVNGLTQTNIAGLAIGNQTVVANRTNLLVGTATIPTGIYSIYNSSANQNYFAGKLGINNTSPSYQLHVRSASTRSATVFTGSGLNDATAGGTYGGSSNSTFTVTIDATGTPDTFKWTKSDGSVLLTGVPIVSGAMALKEGVTITFAATTGHTLNDQWVITVTETHPYASTNNNNGIDDFFIAQDGRMAINNVISQTNFINIAYNPVDPQTNSQTLFIQPLVTINAANAGTYRAAYIEIQDAASTLNQGTYIGANFFVTGRALSGGTVTSIQGAASNANTATTSTGAYTEIKGFGGGAQHFGTGTVTNLYGLGFQTNLRASGGANDGNVTNAYCVWTLLQNLSTNLTGVITSGYNFFASSPGSTGKITSMYGMYVKNQGRANITNSYGFYLEAVTGSATVNYGLISAGGFNGIGVTAPTAVLHLGASTAAASTASLKMNSGTLLSTPESGVVEFDGTNWYLTV